MTNKAELNDIELALVIGEAIQRLFIQLHTQLLFLDLQIPILFFVYKFLLVYCI